MATSKVLQVPKITKIVGSTIYIAHPDVTKYVQSQLADIIAAAGTTAVVYDNNGFANGDYYVVGRIGDGQTEEGSVSGAVTRGQSLTVSNTNKFGHALDDPITKIYERGIKIYGAATDGGSGTLIASIDAITTPIADATMIQWDKPETQYTLISTDTAYNYYYVKFTDGTTDSSASAYVAATGVNSNVIEPLINRALDLTNTLIDGSKFTREMFVDWAQDCQDAVSQFTYQDPVSGQFKQKDWSHEIDYDESIVVAAGQDTYSLSALGLKYKNDDKTIIDVRVGQHRPSRKMRIQDYDYFRRNKARTEVSTQATAGSTTLSVDSTADYNTSGTIKAGSQTLTYTGKTSTTFTGIPASGTGSITSTIAVDTPVTQNVPQGSELRYVMYNNTLYFDMLPSDNDVGKSIKIRFFKALDRITKVSDSTDITFTNVFVPYLASRIESRKENKEDAATYMADWTKQMVQCAEADNVPLSDDYRYYNYEDAIYGTVNNLEVSDYYYNYN